MADDTNADPAPDDEAEKFASTLSAVLFFSLIGLGAATLFFVIGTMPLNWIIAVGYAVYAFVAGLIFATRGCGHDFEQSPDKPRRKHTASRLAPWLLHLPILLPAWLIPPIAAGVKLAAVYDQALAIVTAAFLVEAFVEFPIVARLAICPPCQQRGVCPWMSAKAWKADMGRPKE